VASIAPVQRLARERGVLVRPLATSIAIALAGVLDEL